MRKKFLAFCCVLIAVLILLPGCQPNTVPEDHTVSTSEEQLNSSEPALTPQINDLPVLQLKDVRLLYDCKEYKNLQMNDVGHDGFYNQISFGEIRNKIGDGVLGKALYSVRNLDSGEVSAISQPDSLGKWNVASGVNVLMKGRFLYQWINYGDNSQGAVNKLLQIDAQTNRLTVIKQEIMKKTPFIYCNKLNENEFIYSYCDVENYGTLDSASISVVHKYNVETGEDKEIIRERYQNIEGWQNSTGQLLENVCAIDNQIVAFGRKNENGKYRYYLYQYDAEGRLLETRPAQSLEKVLDNDQAAYIKVLGSYLFFTNWRYGITYIYKIGTDDVTLVAGSFDVRISVASHYENVDSSDKLPYLFYYHRPTDDGDHRDNYLYGIELSTGRTKQIDIKLDTEKPCLRIVQIDENGNMILSMVPNHLKCLDYREFYVTRDTILQLFSEAPYID